MIKKYVVYYTDWYAKCDKVKYFDDVESAFEFLKKLEARIKTGEDISYQLTTI